jgi:hypothetical protein
VGKEKLTEVDIQDPDAGSKIKIIFKYRSNRVRGRNSKIIFMHLTF